MAAKHYQSPRWSGEVADCSMPMTFDQYSNCSYGCLYCFSQYQRALSGAKKNYLTKQVRAVNVEKFKKIFVEPDSSQFGEYVKQRMTMQWGGLSDPFCAFERKHGIGLEILRFLREIEYPVCFSTKGTWWTKDARYVDLFRGAGFWNVKVSIITLDRKRANVMEVGCPSPKERLLAMERISNFGAGGVTLRLRPFIIGLTDPKHIDLIYSAADAGASALSTEFFCFESRSNTLKQNLPSFNELCGFDVAAFYRKYSVSQGYLRLNRKIKHNFILEMRGACRDRGMRFYVSDAHFKEMCDNGSCCGLDENWNYSRGQFCEALCIARKKGTVGWDDISHDMKHLYKVPFGRACGFNATSSEKRALFVGQSMYDYMRWLWNTPSAGQSPYRLFEGVLVPTTKDSENNLVYQYDGSRAEL